MMTLATTESSMVWVISSYWRLLALRSLPSLIAPRSSRRYFTPLSVKAPSTRSLRKSVSLTEVPFLNTFVSNSATTAFTFLG